MTQHSNAPVRLTVNGKPEEIAVPPLASLADVLREELGLTGTKLGCRAGDCGSCTVLVDDVPMVSCLMPVAQAAERRVTTIEGLADRDDHRPLFDAFSRRNASQCGFCIPGILMAAAGLVDREESLTRDEIAKALAGNLCRCTGYESIVAAITDASAAVGERA